MSGRDRALLVAARPARRADRAGWRRPPGSRRPAPRERFELALRRRARRASQPRARARRRPAVVARRAQAPARCSASSRTAATGRALVAPRRAMPWRATPAELAAYLRAPAEVERARRHRGAPSPPPGSTPRARPAVAEALLRAALGAERVAEGDAAATGAPVDVGGAARGRRGAPDRASAIAGYLAQLRWSPALWWIVGARARAAADASGGLASSLTWPLRDRRAGGVAAAVVVDRGPARDRRRAGAARSPAGRPAGARHRVDPRRGDRPAAGSRRRDRGARVAGARRRADGRGGRLRAGRPAAVVLSLGRRGGLRSSLLLARGLAGRRRCSRPACSARSRAGRRGGSR